MKPTLIRAARAGLGWSQETLAKEAGIHPKSVAYWERHTALGGAGTVQRGEGTALPKMQAAFARKGVVVEGHRLTFP
jgi:DNA-binding XRE family transcriptional regulator